MLSTDWNHCKKIDLKIVYLLINKKIIMWDDNERLEQLKTNLKFENDNKEELNQITKYLNSKLTDYYDLGLKMHNDMLTCKICKKHTEKFHLLTWNSKVHCDLYQLNAARYCTHCLSRTFATFVKKYGYFPHLRSDRHCLNELNEEDLIDLSHSDNSLTDEIPYHVHISYYDTCPTYFKKYVKTYQDQRKRYI